MKKIYVPYGFDWRGLTAEEPSIAYCSKCDREFNTAHCIRQVAGELNSYFSHICPGCDSLDHVFGVRMAPESWTLGG